MSYQIGGLVDYHFYYLSKILGVLPKPVHAVFWRPPLQLHHDQDVNLGIHHERDASLSQKKPQTLKEICPVT